MMKSVFPLILCGIILSQGVCQTLTSADLNSQATDTGVVFYGNTIGLSMDLPELIPYLNNTLFRDILLNSNMWGSWSDNFMQSIHVPTGYVYNCSIARLIDSNTVCDFEFGGNSTFAAQVANYMNNVARYGISLGWSIQGSNLSSKSYIKSTITPFFFQIYDQLIGSYSIAISDFGDKITAQGLFPNYTVSTFLQQGYVFFTQLYGVYMAGPGIT